MKNETQGVQINKDVYGLVYTVKVNKIFKHLIEAMRWVGKGGFLNLKEYLEVFLVNRV